MTSPEVELRAAWHRIVADTAAAAAHEPLDHLLLSLLDRHREPHRRYHTATHVMWVLRHVDELVGDGVAPGADLAAVRLAALYHDAVYEPRSDGNEAASAALAVATADRLGWPPERADAVRRLVMATAGHRPTGDDEALLVDADLAVLGGDPASYSAYVTGVRAEYAHVSDADWRVGRAAVLRGFLDAPAVYHTEPMRRRRESRARANLTAELATLR